VNLTPDQLVTAALATHNTVAILDSCGISYLAAHRLIIGVDPLEVIEISGANANESLNLLDEKLNKKTASIFTHSYEFGQKILGQKPTKTPTPEPDIFLARFASLVVHDYVSGKTKVIGDRKQARKLEHLIQSHGEALAGSAARISNLKFEISAGSTPITSDFTKSEYIEAVRNIQERIRDGDTYQTNLTQQFTAELSADTTPEKIFERLRHDHPVPFSAFIRRGDSAIVSASPERFFRIDRDRSITTSPIKGTRRRGTSESEDQRMREELLASEKDRAENTMIVDLLRNDLGRVCKYGSVRVDKLCDLETHPTFHHLVSTISGDLRDDAKFSEVLTALFPCGSITGAPKISTMQIIDEIEPSPRGLSMGAIGYAIDGEIELSVAIRTMVFRDDAATFNVGGGITIDSDPEAEYEESLLKAKALLDALGCS